MSRKMRLLQRARALPRRLRMVLLRLASLWPAAGAFDGLAGLRGARSLDAAEASLGEISGTLVSGVVKCRHAAEGEGDEAARNGREGEGEKATKA